MVFKSAKCCAVMLMVIGLVSCDDDDFPAGATCTVEENDDGTATITCPDGSSATIPSGEIVGMLAGTVTNSLTGAPLADVTVVEEPEIEGVEITTGEDGTFSAALPIGTYMLAFQRQGFEEQIEIVSVVATQMLTTDVVLEPTSPVLITAAADTEGVAPGGSATLDATAESFNATTPVSFAWTQVGGAPATIASPDEASTEVTLANREALIDDLVQRLELPDRTRVVPIFPSLIEEVSTSTFQVEVAMDDGTTFTETVEVAVAELGFHTSTGLNNVATNEPVLVQAGTQAGTYNWSIAVRPDGSSAVVENANRRVAFFTPDVMGEYQLTESTTGASLTLFAGEWVGAITGLNDEGRPVAGGCEACHNDVIAPDRFIEWRETGHAEIFADNFNTSTHYSTTCLECHTVGWNLDADNDGFDDQASYQEFLETFTSDGETFIPVANNYQRLFAEFPALAKRANVQCENCHGPNQSPPHNDGEISASRVSIASEVCAVCHGEAPRHGRYLQWKQSPHASFELAIEEATVESRAPSAGSAGAGHCGRCHAAQGFLAWIEQGDDLTGFLQDRTAPLAEQAQFLSDLGLTEAQVQPQTCVTCHDPHEQGTTSGEPTTAMVRISGTTPFLPAGFRAAGVGRGAICITCHNTRNGPHNDDNPPTSFSAPHAAAQGDVLMGENSYFIAGDRSPHSLINDTCTNCHMEQTPPPPELSFYGAGTNHDFRASLDICSECHGAGIDAEGLQMTTEDALLRLELAAGDVVQQELQRAIDQNDSYAVRAFDPETGQFSSQGSPAPSNVVIDAVPEEVRLVEISGQMALILTLPAAGAIDNPFGAGQVTEVQLQLGSLVSNGTPLFTPDSTFVRALWNYFIMEHDQSFGIHNPGFTLTLMGVTIDELLALLV